MLFHTLTTFLHYTIFRTYAFHWLKKDRKFKKPFIIACSEFRYVGTILSKIIYFGCGLTLKINIFMNFVDRIIESKKTYVKLKAKFALIRSLIFLATTIFSVNFRVSFSLIYLRFSCALKSIITWYM